LGIAVAAGSVAGCCWRGARHELPQDVSAVPSQATTVRASVAKLSANPARYCIDFDYVTPSNHINVGQSFVSNSAQVDCIDPRAPLPPHEGVSIEPVPAGNTVGSGNWAQTHRALLQFELPERTRLVRFALRHHEGEWQLVADGFKVRSSLVPTQMWTSLYTATKVLYFFDGAPTGSTSGLGYVIGAPRTFAFGGWDLFIDDVCVWLDDCRPLESKLHEPVTQSAPAVQTQPWTDTHAVNVNPVSDVGRRLTSVTLHGVRPNSETSIHAHRPLEPAWRRVRAVADHTAGRRGERGPDRRHARVSAYPASDG
jgi:hypothetical protein